LREAVKRSVLLDQRPVEPTQLVVLAIGVVVATLGATYFIAHDDHRYTDGQ
jgi:hypothetical protein